MEDTIVAPSTSPVNSAISVIRVSGRDSLKAARCFSSADRISPRVAVYGTIVDDGKVIDDVVVVYYKAPSSYTGEDVLEISCHGNPLIVQNIINLVLKTGARFAEPGEFTMRAFLNGKMDLTEAEAVNSIIGARSEFEIHSALEIMHGSLRKKISSLKESIIEIKADVEAGIDFSEEDIQFITSEEIYEKASMIQNEVRDLLKRCELGSKLSYGIDIPIVGSPNVGKSSILNVLLNRERAIVSDIPGTTRDMIIETVQFSGIRVNLMDTAGIRESDSEIEKIGIKKTFEAIEKATIIFYVFDASRDLKEEDFRIIDGSKPSIVIFNKVDIVKDFNIPVFELLSGIRTVLFSAKTGLGVEDIEAAVKELINTTYTGHNGSFVADLRVINLLKTSVKNCSKVKKGVKKRKPLEMLAFDLQQLINSLSEITGDVTTDDILGSIFSRFCIGK